MIRLIRWWIQLARGGAINTQNAGRFAQISVVQTVIVVAMLFAATAMARGFGV